MKGPLLTQTLRGLHGRPHWRGDLDGFADFNGAFVSLMGGSRIAAADMADFERWAATVKYPPNPNLRLDRSLTSTQQQGLQAFSQGTVSCMSCHQLPTGSNGKVRDTPQGSNQPMKIAQLRNYYRKSGLSKSANAPVKMGFGLFKDGEAGVIADIRQGGGSPPVEAYLLAFDTGTPPALGRQVQFDATTHASAAVQAELALLEARAQLAEIDLVVRGALDGEPVAFLFDPSQQRYRADVLAHPLRTRSELGQLAGASRLLAQFMGVMRNEGIRALDQDLDGVLDGDARARNYGNPTFSTCGSAPTLHGNRVPKRGQNAFAMVATSAAANGATVLGLAAQPGSVSLFGIEILFGLDSSTLLLSLPTDARGTAVLRLPVPDDAGLIGASVFAQAITLEPCSARLAASPGLRMTVQP
jgi:hypothetical protein